MNRWATLRTIKYKTLLKLSAAVFVLAAVVTSGLVTPLHASAATTKPAAPLIWLDDAHNKAKDGVGNVYDSTGYACPAPSPLSLTNNAGTSISGDSRTTGTKTVNGSSVPSCPNNRVADYVWVFNLTSPHYALLAHAPVSGSELDTKTCAISKTGCTADVWSLTDKGQLDAPIINVESVLNAKSSFSGLTQDSVVPLTCESSGTSLSWIMCPIIEGLAKGVDDIYSGIIQPLLASKPITLDTNDFKYKTWSSFRIYGDIFLVIALLVVVFGQSIGGGLIDAYSAKKILPRLLIAAVLINLSFYLVAFAIDITNIVGKGIQTLLSQPFIGPDALHSNYSLTLNGGTSAALGVSGLLAGATGVWALAAGSGAMLQFLLVFILMPAFFAFLSILAVVIIRQGLIILLLVVSPVAFALYCLPNTEQYFRKWWDLLFRTLLVYPIIAVIFSVANILSVTISKASLDQGGLLATLSQLMSVIALIIPLFLIAFSFKIAGGMLGKFHEIATGLHKRGQETIKGNANDQSSLRNRTRLNAGAAITRERAQTFRRLNKKGLAPRITASLFGNALEKEAQLNQASKQRIFATKDSGDDSIINARASFLDDDNVYRTLDGKEVSNAERAAAKRIYPNLPDLQTIADYRSSKINTTEEAHQFIRNFGMMAQQEGLSAEEATGVYTGLAFARQNERGEFKYGKFAQLPNGRFSYSAPGDIGSFEGDPTPSGDVVKPGESRSGNFIKEQYSKRGTYEGGKMFGSYFQSMGDIKKAHLDKLQNFTAKKVAGGTLTADEAALEQHSRDQLKQIIEIQDSFESGGKYRDPDTGQIIDGGLAGAAAETRAAFSKMKSLDLEPGSGSVNTFVNQARDEISKGQTYEAEHSPTHGDFSSGSRPFKP